MAKYLREIALLEPDLLFEDTFKSFDNGLQLGHEHEHEIGGHHIRVYMARGHYTRPGHYVAGFQVNHDHSRGDVKDKNISHKIMHHIGRTIHSFIKEKKPTVLHMRPYDDQDSTRNKKAGTYHQFAKHLAKQYNGIVKQDPGQFSIHFKPQKTAKYLQRRTASV